ncbi:hypothetical protein GQ55_6G283500 [Panicum hallii var. hallii]|uniref:BZIP domain-containing protein n=1 Tax=Panicum hallii var. hallii TaxID=1504633 RepID=A0A2T7DAH3_9POAL|nr:hypothetical protein GQ55_6G283500 [Panicum hallii var. hallii]
MEPQRGGEQLAWGATGAAAPCLCPAAVASSAAGAPAGNVFPRQALEQEMLRRAELQLQGGGGGDRRRERKMKNRESAARSRARRLAYVNELEKEVSLLRAEKEELRRLCEELKEAAAPAKRGPHQRLQRTSSAPF